LSLGLKVERWRRRRRNGSVLADRFIVLQTIPGAVEIHCSLLQGIVEPVVGAKEFLEPAAPFGLTLLFSSAGFASFVRIIIDMEFFALLFQ